jgi:hypothetical protein
MSLLVILPLLVVFLLLAGLLASRRRRQVLVVLLCAAGALAGLAMVYLVRVGDFATIAPPRVIASPGPQTADKARDVSNEHKDNAESPPPAVRPKWVDAPDGYVGDIYEITVAAGPYSTDPECDAALVEKASQKIEEYMATAYGSSPLITAEVMSQWVTARHRETIAMSVGPMRQLYARLAIGADAKRWFDQQCRQITVRRRMVYFGVALASVLALLAATWLGLRRG